MADVKKSEFSKGKTYETSAGEFHVDGPAATDKDDHSHDGYVCQHCGYEGVPNLVSPVVKPPQSIACPECGLTEHER